MRKLIKFEPFWVTLVLSLFLHLFLISRFDGLLGNSANKKIMGKSYLAHISLKLKTNLPSLIDNSVLPNLESVPGFQDIKNLYMERKILHNNKNKKEITPLPLKKEIEDQGKIIENYTPKGSLNQFIEEERPKNLAEIKGEDQQINQDSKKEQYLLSPSKNNENLKEKLIQEDFYIVFQEAEYKDEDQVKENQEMDKILDFTKDNYPDNINPPELIEFQLPVYPKNLRERGIEGKVLLKVLIDEEGKTQEVQIFKSSRYRNFDNLALESVQQWRFKPAKEKDQPRESWVLIPINFQLK